MSDRWSSRGCARIPIEFLKWDKITEQYGPNGIQNYRINASDKKAVISDDTQMTIFTAHGLLSAIICNTGEAESGLSIVEKEYQAWMITQDYSYQEYLEEKPEVDEISFPLLQEPRLFARRAPGNTCVSALNWRKQKGKTDDYIANPLNSSKGCGGVMRVASLGCFYSNNRHELINEGAQIAAITHGHPLGYIPAGMLVSVINQIVFAKSDLLLEKIIRDALDETREVFGKADYFSDFVSIIERAIELSKNTDPDIVNIKKLGEGWVAEETLAIAVYCALRYQNDFSKAVIASVNHDGDSDSTGAVTGNIIGAYLGFSAIDSKWTQDLEMMDLLSRISEEIEETNTLQMS